MSRNKLIILISGSIIAVGGTLLAIFLLQNSNHSLQLQGANGLVKTKDFIRNAKQKYQNSVVVPVSDDISIESDVAISYDTHDQSFHIAFTSDDLADINTRLRPIAEAKLLVTLGINKDEACKLKVYETLPGPPVFDFPPSYYPMSFCPGGDLFPKQY